MISRFQDGGHINIEVPLELFTSVKDLLESYGVCFNAVFNPTVKHNIFNEIRFLLN